MWAGHKILNRSAAKVLKKDFEGVALRSYDFAQVLLSNRQRKWTESDLRRHVIIRTTPLPVEASVPSLALDTEAFLSREVPLLF
jgi:hypothetical protein